MAFDQTIELEELIENICFDLGECFVGTNYVVEFRPTFRSRTENIEKLLEDEIGDYLIKDNCLNTININTAFTKIRNSLLSEEQNKNRDIKQSAVERSLKKLDKLFLLIREYLRPGEIQVFQYAGDSNAGIFWGHIIVFVGDKSNKSLVLKCGASD